MKIKTYISATLLILLHWSPYMSGQEASSLTLSLEQCRQMSLLNDPSIENARLDCLAAKTRKQEAFAEYFPSVSVSAFGFWAFKPMLEIGVTDILGDNDFSRNIENLIAEYAPQYGLSPTYTTLKYGWTASASLMQPLYAGGRIVNGNRLASLGAEAAQSQYAIKSRSNLQTLEQNYWQAVSLQEKQKTLRQMGQMLDSLYKDVSSAVDAGVAVKTDLMQVEMGRNNLCSGISRLNGGLRLAKMNLFNSIGQPYAVVKASSDTTRPFIDDIILDDVLDDFPSPEQCYMPEEQVAAGLDESKLLQMNVESKRLEKKMAMGEALPSVGIGASYGYSQILNGRANGSLYAMVKIPVSDWGKTSRKMQRLGYQIQQAENDREYLSSQLVLKMRQLYLELTCSWEQLQIAKENVELSRLCAEQMTLNYEAGLSTMSELMQARTKLRQAYEEQIDQTIAYRNALTAYTLMTGRRDN